MAWPRKTVRVRVDRDLAEALTGAPDVSLSPDALSRALRAHAECERERQRLVHAMEQTGRDVLVLQDKYRDLVARYDGLIQENARLLAERRRLDETLRELRRRGARG